ncbi:MAG: LEA type 2 family protein [Myxococcales bacterium]|nr:LEA type 2 family protein [Myxococcales bacterium]
MRALASTAVACALALASGCARPDPPTITPKEAKITAIDPSGIDVVLAVDAENPNRVALTARSVTASVKLDGRYALAPVTVTKPITLPAAKKTSFDVKLHVPWQDVQTLVSLGLANRAIPYTVTGTVTVGGERLNVDVPYTINGTITREQLIGTGLRSLPKIPGLTISP